MSDSVTPTRSLVGGLLLIPPVHALLLANSSIYGISGFIHRAFRPSLYHKGAGWEALAGVAGLVAGGIAVGGLELGHADGAGAKDWGSLGKTVGNGLMIGIGTRLANGCTSGHMISGLTRLSLRSVVATSLFFVFGGTTATYLHSSAPSPVGDFVNSYVWDWSMGSSGWDLVTAWALVGTSAWVIQLFRPVRRSNTKHPHPEDTLSRTTSNLTNTCFRSATTFLLSTQFALALHLSSLTSQLKVINFLRIFPPQTWDPSLLFLAIGALPASILLYQTYTRKRLVEGAVPSPKADKRWKDWRLVVGATVFGVGWGANGFCPGPGLVGLGRACMEGQKGKIMELIAWLGGVVIGGFVVPS